MFTTFTYLLYSVTIPKNLSELVMLKSIFSSKSTQNFLKTSFGNILEWYDFTVYGLLAIQLAQVFFPNNNKFTGLIIIFATFAIGFVARPFGSLLFGIIGDKYGNYYAVTLSIWLMAISSGCISLLPDYQTIGIYAPLLLVFLRICQGLSAGGQFSGLITIAVNTGTNKTAFLVSLVHAIAVAGGFLASLIVYLNFNLFTQLPQAMLSIAWRIPFGISFILFMVYLWLNPYSSFHVHTTGNKIGIRKIFQVQPQKVLLLIGLSTINFCNYYILFTYSTAYIQIHLQISSTHSFIIINSMLFLSIFLYPLFGYIAKDILYRISYAQKMCILYLLGISLFTLIPLHLIFGMAGLVIMVTAFCAIASMTTGLLAEMFPKSYRMTACSLIFNAGGIIGGFAPILAETANNFSAHLGLPILLVGIIISLFIILQYIKQLVLQQTP